MQRARFPLNRFVSVPPTQKHGRNIHQCRCETVRPRLRMETGPALKQAMRFGKVDGV
jgi:hypothetical protein